MTARPSGSSGPSVYFHGGAPGLWREELLLPRAVTGMPAAGDARLAAQGRGDPRRVYLTPVFAFAVVSASMYAASRGHAGTGAVYEAVPCGPVGGPVTGLAGVEVTAESARVTRVVRARSGLPIAR